MTLRLVLVSIVACVGLSLPSAERLERWTRSRQAWKDGALVDDGQYIVVADAVDAPRVFDPEPSLAAPSLASPSEDDSAAKTARADWLAAIEREVAPPAPTALDPTTFAFADLRPEAFAAAELDRLEAEAVHADWLAAIEREAAPPSATSDDPALFAVPGEHIEVVATVASGPVAPTADELAWWDAWLSDLSDACAADSLSAQAPALTAAVPSAASADEAFRAIVDEMASSFSKDAVGWAARPKEESPKAVLTAQVAPVSSAEFERIQTEWAAPRDVTTTTARKAETVAPAAPAPVRNRLTHAVRLTREAVNAWASVLHGPALLTLER